MLKQGNAILVLAAGILVASSAIAQGKGSGHGSGIGGPGVGHAHGPTGTPSGQSNKIKPASLLVNSQGSAPGAKSPVTMLEQNTKLSGRLAPFFPEGTDLSKEAAGFKNLGQFVSAVHVSHNLGIPFDNLKCAELGTSAATQQGVACSPSIINSDPMSLGKTIQQLRPDAKPERAIQEANQQAEKDLQESAHN